MNNDKRAVIMDTIVINVGDDINIADFSARLKELYPTLRIESTPASRSKIFAGVNDLKPLHINGFKMYQREDLYDR